MASDTPVDGAHKLTPGQYWAVTLAVMAASLIQFLDMTICNVALPHMQAALNASIDTVSWVLTSFIVSSAVAIPATGWIVARHGTRLPFLVAIAGFIATSMLCGMANSLTEMVAFRLLQGIPAAFITPISQAILLDITPREKHTRALSIWGMTSMLGPILGPTLGGFLTDNLNWRWVFYINLPVGIPALLILWRFLPGTPTNPRPFDRFGYVFLVIAIAAFQLMIDRGEQNDWFDSGETVVEALLAVFSAAVFIIHSRYHDQPLFPLAIVTKPTVWLSIVLGAVLSWMLMGVASILPGLLENLLGYSAMQTGETMAPRGVAILIVMLFIPRLMARFSLRSLFVAGFVLVAFTNWQMTGWTPEMDSWRISVNAFVQGIGLGMLMVPSNFLSFIGIPGELRTDVASFTMLVRSMAGGASISLLVTVLTRSTRTTHEDLVSAISNRAIALPDSLGGVAGQPAVASALDALVSRQATMVGYLEVFWVLTYVALAAIPLCLAVRVKADPR